MVGPGGSYSSMSRRGTGPLRSMGVDVYSAPYGSPRVIFRGVRTVFPVRGDLTSQRIRGTGGWSRTVSHSHCGVPIPTIPWVQVRPATVDRTRDPVTCRWDTRNLWEIVFIVSTTSVHSFRPDPFRPFPYPYGPLYSQF